MRINEPKRPTEDQSRNAEQFYKWMYQATEQLNMMMEQLERNNVIDLMATHGSSAENGLIGGSIEENTEELEALRTEQENINKRLAELNTEVESAATEASKAVEATEVLEAQLGGMTVLVGTSTVSFGTATHYVDVKFGKTFASKPVVFTNQVFNQHNLVSIVDYVTTTQFRVTAPAGVSTSNGTRAFNWVAIGKIA